MRARFPRRAAPVSAVLLLAAFVPGCLSLGFRTLRPGEDAGYDSLFGDVLPPHESPKWLWARGFTAGDFDGDGKAEEEAVVATVQEGDPFRPGLIEQAYLAICKPDGNGGRIALARTMLFENAPDFPPGMTHGPAVKPRRGPMRHIRAQTVSDRLRSGDSAVVYCWGDSLPAPVWYKGYGMEGARLREELHTVEVQSAPGFMVMNLDKRGTAGGRGSQLAFPLQAIPGAVAAKFPKQSSVPVWGVVFSRDEKGVFRRIVPAAGPEYSRFEATWSHGYLEASMLGLPPEELAWFEYHLGLLYLHRGESFMAEGMLRKAAEGAADASLAEAVRKARAHAASLRAGETGGASAWPGDGRGATGR